jgi:hypothetical protein
MFELLVLTERSIELVSHVNRPRIVLNGLRGTPDGSGRPDEHDSVANDEQPQEDAGREVERAKPKCFSSNKSHSKSSHRSSPSAKPATFSRYSGFVRDVCTEVPSLFASVLRGRSAC